jgi:hypothetical protein
VTDREGNSDIYSRTLFSDEDKYVDDDPAEDINPTMTTLGLTEHWCCWQSNRSGNWDIWGSYIYATGVEEDNKPQAPSFKPGQTIVRGALFLPVSPFTLHYSLFDITGRAVMSLRPGANDVSRLPPGIYFVRERLAAGVRKVIIQH